MKMFQMRRASILFVAAALAVFGLAACGGDDEEGDDSAVSETTTTEETTAGGGGAASTLKVAAPADGSFAYEPSELSAKAGTVTVEFDNPASLSHDVVIEDQSGNEVGKTDLVSQGSATTTVELTAGSYTYYCDVPGHREGGMEGPLTVK
jgi:plastocyanin